MTPRAKCWTYISINALIPVGECFALVKLNQAWPTQFDFAALGVQVLLQGLLAYKMYWSDPAPKKDLPPTKNTETPKEKV